MKYPLFAGRPVAVLKALDYMESISPAASGILDIQAMMMQNLRLVEGVRVVEEWIEEGEHRGRRHLQQEQ